MRSISCRGVRGKKAWSIATLIAMLVSTGGPIFNTTVQAQIAPVGAGFVLNAGDLRFIFHAIEIAETPQRLLCSIKIHAVISPVVAAV